MVPNWKSSMSRLYIVTLLYLTYTLSTSCEMPSWMKLKHESRLLGEISITSDMQILPNMESKEELSFLMKMKEESEKAGLKLNIHKTKIMASGPITLWQIDVEKAETVADFIFLGQNHCRHCHCSGKIKMLAPWKKNYDKPRQHIKKQRHHFADKGPYSQSYDFSSSHLWMWELNHKEGWA